MKQKGRWLYHCDHCGKSSTDGAHIKRHEDHCTKNPGRTCPMCAVSGSLQQPMVALIEALAEGSPAQVARLVELSDGCPACVAAAIEQSPSVRPAHAFSGQLGELGSMLWEETDLEAARRIFQEHEGSETR